MTNKEHLATLKPEEWWARIDWLYHVYGKSYTSSPQAIMHWIEEEYKIVEPILGNEPDRKFYFCPVCYSPILEGSKKCWKCITELKWKNESQ